MYEAIGIQKLSENQLRKLLKGEPVRIKMGSHHKIHLSIHQLKKLHTAHKKGKASTITFDPYQRDKHGEGIFGDIARHIKGVAHKHRHLLNPIIHSVKGAAHQGVHHLSKYAHNKIDSIKGFGLGHSKNKIHPGHLSKLQEKQILQEWDKKIERSQERARRERELNLPESPTSERPNLSPYELHEYLRHNLPKAHHRLPTVGEGLIGAALNGGGDLANIIGGHGSGEASQVLKGIGSFANMFGLGMKHRKKRTTRGKGFLTDLAKKGLKAVAPDLIDKGAEFAKKTVNGMGARRRVGRLRKHHHSHHHGGALMPAGF